MMLVRLERDATGQEASEFVAALAARFVEFVDKEAILDDIQNTPSLDEERLRDILVGHFEAFAQGEDEEILDWVIDYLMKGGE